MFVEGINTFLPDVRVKKMFNPRNYSSGDSEQDETRANFKFLTGHDRREHIIELWRQTYLKAKGAFFI